jgi:hypothetical protein
VKKFKIMLAATLCTFIGTYAYAHHSSAPHFDADTPVQIEGVVTAFKFVNPHAWLYIDVTDADGNVANWNCEMGAATGLRRSGWTKELFSPGTIVRIDGIAARRDPHGCSFRSGDFEDGTHIARNGEITKGDSAPVVASAIPSTGPAVVEVADTTALVGMWVTTPRNRRGGGGNGPPGAGSDRFANLLTDEGIAALAEYDMRFDDPALQCSPSSIIRGWTEPGGVSEVTQTPEQVVIKHEFMDTVRVVDLTTREHPANPERGVTGHSVGWFEDSTLVIETVGFAAGVLLPHPGLLHSENMRVVERLSLAEDGAQLIRQYEVSDPDFFKETYAGRSSWTRTDLPLTEYGCEELGGISNIRTEEAE